MELRSSKKPSNGYSSPAIAVPSSRDNDQSPRGASGANFDRSRELNKDKLETAYDVHHARDCLYAAGDILQTVFYAYREAVFEMPVSKIEKDAAGNIHIYTKDQGSHDADLVHYLPRSYFRSREDRQAVLSYDACGEAPGHMFELTKKLLNGLKISIAEAQIRLKEEHCIVVRHSTDESPEHDRDFKHELTIIKLANGAQYVLDIAGAQYGQHHAVIPYDHYMERFEPETIIKDATFGLRHASLTADLEGRNDDNLDHEYDMRIDQIQAQVTRHFNKAVEDWEKKYDTTVRSVLDETGDHQLLHTASLLTKITDSISMYMLEWRTGGCKLEPRGSKLCYENKDTPVKTARGGQNVTPITQKSTKHHEARTEEWGAIDDSGEEDDGDSEEDYDSDIYDDTQYGTGTQYGWL